MRNRCIPAGELVVQLAKQCVRADQPLMLEGEHGCGKSELLKVAADEIGIDLILCDLSLMEPSDLVGMPYIDSSGRTRFAPPAFLPSEGRGIFAIEEINRAPRYMRAPCLQLLTERRLNDYELPSGWVPMASINPDDGDYQVDPLGAALRSRFVQVLIKAEVQQWTRWARRSEQVDDRVIKFVEQSPGIFDRGETNPRSWTYLSNQLRAFEEEPIDAELFLVAASGLVGESWAIAFHQFINGGDAPLTAPEVIDRYENHQQTFKSWASGGKLDLVRASMHRVQRSISEQSEYQSVAENETRVKRVRQFIDDLPADLHREMREWLEEKNYDLGIAS